MGDDGVRPPALDIPLRELIGFTMKTKYLLLPLLGGAALLSSCVVDPYGNIMPYAPVYYGPYYGPYAYAGPYGYYGPYGYGGFYGDPFFWFGGITYYNYHGRYCYYDHGHRVFVPHLPSGGHYMHGSPGYHGPVGGGTPHQTHYSLQGQHYANSGNYAATGHGAQGAAGQTGTYRGGTGGTGSSHGSSSSGFSREHR